MEQNDKLLKPESNSVLLLKLERHMEEQTQQMQKQLRFSRICTLCCVCALLLVIVAGICYVPKINHVLESATVLIDGSKDSMEEALQAVRDIDIDTLNKAISDLYNVINPLAGLFNR